MWSEYCSLSIQLQRQFREARLRRWYELPVATTSGALGYWKSWAKWAHSEGINDKSPSHTVVELWLHSCFARGNTAPLGAFHGVRFLEKQIGFCAGSDKVDKRSIQAPGSHEVQQVAPMHLIRWVLLEGTMSHLAQAKTAI